MIFEGILLSEIFFSQNVWEVIDISSNFLKKSLPNMEIDSQNLALQS